MMPEQRPFPRREEKRTLHPRRVRGGVRLSRKDADLAASWAAQRIIRLIEGGVAGEALREGLEYARLGQTKTFRLAAGKVEALIQGRSTRPYQTRLELPAIKRDGWERVTKAMAEQAVYSARLLGGEVPSNIEDAFAPSALHLFPANLEEFTGSCTCGHATPWCKHAACAAYLLADRLGTDPLLMFELRGIERDELMDSLRAGRTTTPAGVDVPVYIPTSHGDGVAPLGECVENFWEAGPELDLVDLPIEAPQVSHPLLRRLGPSPFPESRFPLVGLLATCYDVVSARVLEERGEAEDAETRDEAGGVDAGSEVSDRVSERDAEDERRRGSAA